MESKSVTVHEGDQTQAGLITDMVVESDVPNVRNPDGSDFRDDLNTARRVWILDQLASGRQLQAPDVAKEFNCHVKTAQRDLTALKEAKIIEFVGAPRTGYYRLRMRRPPAVN